MKSQNRLAQRGLAAAALPDDPQDFTVIGSHRYIVNDMLFALFFPEGACPCIIIYV